VHLDDVVAALSAMVGSQKAVGERFHVSGPGFSYDRAAGHAAKRLDLPVEGVVVPDEYSFDIDVSHTTERLGWQPEYDVFRMIDAAVANAGDG
jgi:nucleoside-diphosphate-sugar epimerase